MATIRQTLLTNGNLRILVFDETKMIPDPAFARVFEFAPRGPMPPDPFIVINDKMTAERKKEVEQLNQEMADTRQDREQEYAAQPAAEAMRAYKAEFAGQLRAGVEAETETVVNLDEV